MRIRRRTAAALCLLGVLLSAAGVLAYLLQPERLRTFALAEVRGMLNPGFDVELDGVDYDLREGVFKVEGLRLVRLGKDREVLASIPGARVTSRLWQVLSSGTVTDVVVEDPEILVERTEEGIALGRAFRTGGGGAGHRPRIRLTGGLITLRDASVLAPGADLRLALEGFEWQESRDGGPSALEVSLREIGAESTGGGGAVGAVTVRGDLPLSGDGIRMSVERFTWDAALRARLTPAVLRQTSDFDLEGTFGEGPAAPALEVAIAAGEEPLTRRITAAFRPRGARLLPKALPIPLVAAGGTITWRGADESVELDDLLVRRGETEIHARGRVAGLGGEFTGEIGFWARGLDLDGEFREALPAGVRRVWDAYAFSGLVDVTGSDDVDGSYDSYVRRKGPGEPLEVGVAVRLLDGAMTFNGFINEEDGVRYGFAWPVEEITGRVIVEWTEGGATVVDLRDLAGRHGAVEVAAHGRVRDFGGGRAEVALVIEADDLPLDEDVRNASAGMADLFERFSPAGRVGHLRVVVEQVPDLDDGAHEAVSLDFDGAADFTYAELPLRMTGVSGHVDYRWDRSDGGRVLTVALQGIRGSAEGGGTISVDGTVEGEEAARLSLFLRGTDIPLGGPLQAALRAAEVGAAVSVWDMAAPSGIADFTAEITGRDLPGERREEYHVQLRGVAVGGWGGIRYPLTGLTGTVDVLPGEVVLSGLRGQGSEGPVALDGTVSDPGGDAALDLRILAEDALLDDSLREALGPAAENAAGYFDFVRPAPGFRGSVDVRLQGRAEAVEPVIEAMDLRGVIRPLDVRNLDVAGGRARYEEGRVLVKGLVGAMGDREFSVRRAAFDLDGGTGEMDLEIRRLRFPRDLLGLLDEETVAAIERVTPDRFFHVDRLDVALSDGFDRILLEGVVSFSPTRPGRNDGLGLQGVFDLEGLVFERKRGERPRVELKGVVLVEDGRIQAGVSIDDLAGRLDLGGSFGPDGNGAVLTLSGASGRVEGRSLEGASAVIEVNPDGVLLRELRGRLARGDLGGWLQVHPGEGGYEGRFTLSGARARDLLSPTDPDASIQGRVSAGLWLKNRTGKLDDMGGEIQVDITEGALFRVPLFDSIYGLLRLSSPPEFTSGRFQADIHGDRMRIGTFDLDSSVLGLHKAVGGSFLWLDGKVDLKLSPEFKGVTTWPVISWLFDLTNLLWKPVYERLHTIRVTGTMEKPVVNQEWLPFLTSRPEGQPPLLPPPPAETGAARRPVWDF